MSPLTIRTPSDFDDAVTKSLGFTPTPIYVTRRGLWASALVGALLGLWISPGRAYSAELDCLHADPGTDLAATCEGEGWVIRKGFAITPRDVAKRVTLSPCVLEDDARCYWDADTMGNGEGHDFVVTKGGRHYRVKRIVLAG